MFFLVLFYVFPRIVVEGSFYEIVHQITGWIILITLVFIIIQKIIQFIKKKYF